MAKTRKALKQPAAAAVFDAAEVFGDGPRAPPAGEEGEAAMEGDCAVPGGGAVEPEVTCPVILIINFCPNMQCFGWVEV